MAGIKKSKVGFVLGNKMDKTAIVVVSRRIKHPNINKYFVKKKKFKVHDAKNEYEVGDQVEIFECRPISREKSWVVSKIISRGSKPISEEITV